MATKPDAKIEVEKLIDWADFKRVLRNAHEKDRLYAYLKLLDFQVGRKQAQPTDLGRTAKDDAEKMVDEMFNKK